MTISASIELNHNYISPLIVNNDDIVDMELSYNNLMELIKLEITAFVHAVFDEYPANYNVDFDVKIIHNKDAVFFGSATLYLSGRPVPKNISSIVVRLINDTKKWACKLKTEYISLNEWSKFLFKLNTSGHIDIFDVNRGTQLDYNELRGLYQHLSRLTLITKSIIDKGATKS